tara:strand:+ start:15 stop:290 length:276 start_codon:yes stop_codon:yes gene_type:complete
MARNADEDEKKQAFIADVNIRDFYRNMEDQLNKLLIGDSSLKALENAFDSYGGKLADAAISAFRKNGMTEEAYELEARQHGCSKDEWGYFT